MRRYYHKISTMPSEKLNRHMTRQTQFTTLEAQLADCQRFLTQARRERLILFMALERVFPGLDLDALMAKYADSLQEAEVELKKAV